VTISVEAPPLERKLVAIVVADVEGYSRLMHEDEERTLATWTAHRRIIDDLIAADGGDLGVRGRQRSRRIRERRRRA